MDDTPENRPSPPDTGAPLLSKFCSHCGTPNTPEAQFCQHCGQPLAEPAATGKKTCTGCRTVNEPDSVYCWKCGLRLPAPDTSGRSLKYGGFWIRLGAYLIDNIILSTVAGMLFLPFYLPFLSEIAAVNIYNYQDFWDWYIELVTIAIFANVLQIVAFSLYYTIAVGKWGTTIGKSVCGLKVVRSDGTRVTYRRAFARYWAHLINSLVGGLTFIVIAIHEKKQGIHDLICDTLVVKKH